MIIGTHGGECCGIKHIYCLEDRPGAMVGDDYIGDDFDEYIVEPETASKRLDRLIDIISHDRKWFNAGCVPNHARKKHGVIEVVLAKSPPGAAYYIDQVKHWRRALIRRGFKLVTKALNSNSGNHIYIYHLVY